MSSYIVKLNIEEWVNAISEEEAVNKVLGSKVDENFYYDISVMTEEEHFLRERDYERRLNEN